MASKIFYTVVAVVGIAGASGAAWWFQNDPQAVQTLMAKFKGGAPAPAAAPGGPRAVGVEVAKVEVMMLRDDAQAVGSLRSRQNVMMRPEIAGRIMALGFTDGARVNAGQTLVQLDDTLQRAEVQQSLAQVSIAKANFVRNQELVAQNFVAQRVLDESAASLQVAEAQLSLSCARLDRMRIVAPFSGVVGIRNVNLGDYVKDGADLINLEDIGSLYVDFRLPERYQGKLTLQQSVELELDAFPNRIFRAKVEAIDPLIDANGRSIGVRALLPNTGGEPKPLPAGARPAGAPAAAAAAPKPAAAKTANPPTAPASANLSVLPAQEVTPRLPSLCPPNAGLRPPVAAQNAAALGPLRPGMFARATAVFAVKPEAMAVPEEAIVPQGGRQFVIQVMPVGSVPPAGPLPPNTEWVSKRTEVKLGIRRPGRVEVLEGLNPGDTVVVAGQQRLQKDGTALRLVEMGRGPAGASGGSPGGAPAGAGTSSGAPNPAGAVAPTSPATGAPGAPGAPGAAPASR
jgi:membrane fusion protein (multidrug efflux system)